MAKHVWNMEAGKCSLDLMYPRSMLIDALKVNDIPMRVGVIRSLPQMAKAMGPERTRVELIPYLADRQNIRDVEEVITALANVAGKLTSAVGGPDHVTCLLPILEPLAEMKETAIREEAVESLKHLAAQHSAIDLEAKFVPLVIRLANNFLWTARVSACALFSIAYPRVSFALKSELRSELKMLCRDEVVTVRRAAVIKLSEFMRMVDPVYIKSDIFQMFIHFTQDPHESVRMLLLGPLVTMAGFLKPDDIRQMLMPTWRQCHEEGNWMTRRMLAEKIVDFQKVAGPELTVQELLPMFQMLLKDPESEVRAVAVKKVKEFCEQIDVRVQETVIVNFIIPCFQELVNDPDEHVKINLASILMTVAHLVGKSSTDDQLIPIFLFLLDDQFAEVRLKAMSHVVEMGQFIGISHFSQLIIPMMMKLGQDKNWRMRLATIQYLPVLAAELGSDYWEDDFNKLCANWLGDSVAAIREAGVELVKTLLTSFGTDWVENHIVPKVVDLAKSPNYLFRMSSLHFISVLGPLCGPDLMSKYFVGVVTDLAKDPVPNVKMKLSKTLLTIGHLFDEIGINSTFKPILDKMMEERDEDVKRFAFNTAISLGTHEADVMEAHFAKQEEIRRQKEEIERIETKRRLELLVANQEAKEQRRQNRNLSQQQKLLLDDDEGKLRRRRSGGGSFEDEGEGETGGEVEIENEEEDDEDDDEDDNEVVDPMAVVMATLSRFHQKRENESSGSMAAQIPPTSKQVNLKIPNLEESDSD